MCGRMFLVGLIEGLSGSGLPRVRADVPQVRAAYEELMTVAPCAGGCSPTYRLTQQGRGGCPVCGRMFLCCEYYSSYLEPILIIQQL